MSSVPLHPMVVHFPMVLMILVPIAALAALWAIRRGATPRKAWSIPLALCAALSLSAFVALRTGAAQEERVEAVLSEQVLAQHEEAAERFLVLSGVLLAVAAAGLVGGTIGTAARIVATIGAIGLVGAGVQVGKAGGELVYVHGAANAYVNPAAAASAAGIEGAAERRGPLTSHARTADARGRDCSTPDRRVPRP